MTGLIVALVVLALGTGIGLWRRRTDGQFRPVGRGGSSAAARQRRAATVLPVAGTVPSATATESVTSRTHAAGATAEPVAAVDEPAAATVESVAVADHPATGRSVAATTYPVPVVDEPAAAAVEFAAVADHPATGRSVTATTYPVAAAAEPVAAPAERPAGSAGPVTASARSAAAAEGSPGGDALDGDLLAGLGVRPAQATLLQFSTAFCAPCRAVRRVSSEVAAMIPGVQHVEVDAESHLEAVRALNIWRTPTLLVLDADGRLAKRATGVPSKPQLIAALGEILPGQSAPDRP